MSIESPLPVPTQPEIDWKTTRELATKIISLGEQIFSMVTIARPQTPTPSRLQVSVIMRTVAAHYGFTFEELLLQDRRKKIAECRQVAMFLSREMTNASLTEIGDEFLRDHGAVFHAVQNIKGRCELEPEFSAAVLTLADQLKKVVPEKNS